MKKQDKVEYKSGDNPITGADQDQLKVKSRIVNKIFNFLSCSQFSTLTIAITGAWGSGKSSVMNLLKEELQKDKKNIVIEFEPLLEGKFAVPEIMELFYLKLYAALETKGDKCKSIIKKLLLSLGAIALTGTKLGVPETVEINLGEKYEALLKIWKDNDIQSFSQQTKELNEYLNIPKLKIFVFIDEIDRLPATHIISFLMFARILETFENLICIVGIDYGQVIETLKSCPTFSVSDYERARNYLDKLFHTRFHVNHNSHTMISFAAEILNSFDLDALTSIIRSDTYDVQSKLKSIINYLKTPRQLKKWLTLISINKELIDYYPGELLNFLMLVAVCVKHPIVLENLADHTLPMLNSGDTLALHVKERYGLDELFTKPHDPMDDVILPSTGLEKLSTREFTINIVREYITDSMASCFMKEILENTKVSLLSLFVDGYIDKDKVQVYHNYFGSDIDKAIQWLIEADVNDAVVIASDLDDALLKQHALPTKAAGIVLLNNLWQKTLFPDDIVNPYRKIILFTLNLHPIEQVIKNADLSLLEAYIRNILGALKIVNENGAYNLNFVAPQAFKTMELKKRALQTVTFDGKKIASFNKAMLEKLLKCWIARVEQDFDNNLSDLFKDEEHLISVFYRYIQWATAIGISDKNKKLADYIKTYLSDKTIASTDEKQLLQIINQACSSFQNNPTGDNPIKQLFADDKVLITTLKKLIERHDNTGKYSALTKVI